MKIHLQYGREGLDVEVPGNDVTILSPHFVPGLQNEHQGFIDAVRAPIQAEPLREIVRSGEHIAIVIADVTRPLPSARLLPWIFAELSHVPAKDFTVIIGNGTHRACTDAEIELLVGPEIARDYRVVNHDAYDDSTLAIAAPHAGYTLR